MREGDAIWPFAVAVYAAPGVRDLCLALQDAYGADVVLVLGTAWLWSRKVALDPPRLHALAAACRCWQDDVVAPLRQARRALRADAIAGPGLHLTNIDVAALKADVQTLELRAERLQLEAIAAWTQSWPLASAAVPLASVLAVVVPSVTDGRAWQPLAAAVGARVRVR